MPVMAAKESCSPAAATESGFATTRMSRPAHSEVSPSASRPSSGAKSTSAVMNAARSTDGLHPAMTTAAATSKNRFPFIMLMLI